MISSFIFGNAMADDYRETFDSASEKFDKSGMKALTEKEAVAFTIWWLEAEINNGGFHQYFGNSAGDDYLVAINSLRLVGALKTANIMRSAVTVAFIDAVPVNRQERQRLLEKNETEKYRKLNEFDSEFLKYTDDISELVNVFLSK